MFWGDIAILVAITLFTLYGLWSGFLGSVVSLIGMVVSTVVATSYFESVAAWVVYKTGWDLNFVRTLSFVVIIFLVARLIYLIFWGLQHFFAFLRWIPFTRTINRILGAIFGFVEGVVVVGLFLYFLFSYPVAENLMLQLQNSFLTPYLLGLTQFLLRFIPNGLEYFDAASKYII